MDATSSTWADGDDQDAIAEISPPLLPLATVVGAAPPSKLLVR